MENQTSVLDSPEQVDKRLQGICKPEFGGVPPGDLYEAVGLFAAMQGFFQNSPGEQILGFRSYNEWTKGRRKGLGVSHGYLYTYPKIHEFLVPLLSDPKHDLQKLSSKFIELAKVAAKAPQKLTSDFLRESFDMSGLDVKERVASLLGKESLSPNDIVIDSHTTAQAVLLWLGGWDGYDTYTAHRGEKFRGGKLGDIATLSKLDLCGPPGVLKAAKSIDVIWLKGNWPKYFFEVEHTQDITAALHRMFQVVDFDAKFFVVALPHARSRFQREIAKALFNERKEKYFFRTYIELRKLYRKASPYREASKSFFRLDPS